MSRLVVQCNQEESLWCDLYWDGIFWKKIYKSLFVKDLKIVRSASSLEEAELFFQEMEEKAAKRLVVSLLSRKAEFRSILVKKLEEKGISSSTILKVLTFYENMGAFNDRDLIDCKIQSELRRGKGLYYAKGKWLKTMGPDTEEVEWYSPERQELEKESIIRLLQKKGKVWNVLDRKEKSALVLFLLRRGFRKETIEAVLF